MKIRFITTFSSPKCVYVAGNEYDVENGEAISYLDRGLARKAPESGHTPTITPPPASPFAPGEQLGAKPGLPNATPSATPALPPSDNPVGVMHPGMNTSEPSAQTSPPSDGATPYARPDSGSSTPAATPAEGNDGNIVIAGRKLAAYAGKTDAELQAMPGVNDAVVKKIRKAEKDAAK